MKTIAEQLNVTEFPFRVKDSNGNLIYSEYSNGYWWRGKYDANGNKIYFENSRGEIEDKRSKPYEDRVVEIDGVKYKLTKI
jgi:hypothetical protein